MAPAAAYLAGAEPGGLPRPDAAAGGPATSRAAGAVRPAPGPWASWLWLGYLGVGAVAVGWLCLVPTVGGWLFGRMVVCCAVSASSAAAVVAGLRLHRPRPRLPWQLIGISQLSFLGTEVVFYVTHYLLRDRRVPGFCDVVYLAHYPVLVAGVLLIVRLRAPGGDLPALLDGLLVATGATTLSVLYLIGPRLHGDLSPLVAVTAVGFPIADLVVFTIGLWLLFGSGPWPPAFVLLASSLFAILTADTGYGLRQLNAGYAAGGPLDGLWLAGSLALGAAALHPTMARIAQPSSRPAGLGRIPGCAACTSRASSPRSR